MNRLPIVTQVLLTLLVIFAMAGVAVYPLTAAAIGLNQNSMIDGNTVKLGDVFTGLPRDADKVIGPAPLPGKQMVLDSRTLLRIALALDLPWRPETQMDYVVLKSSAAIVDRDMMETSIKTALADKGVNGNYKIVYDTDPQSMALPKDTAPGADVISMNFRQSGWFDALVAAPSKDKVLASQHVTGRVIRLAKVPVLRESLNTGTVIGERDLDYVDIPEKNLSADTVLKAESLIGMAPRHIVMSGQPVNSNDIESPRMVGRGDIVTMIFSEGSLHLTAQGKALENGAKGDHIRVINTASNKTILAEVTNNREVTLAE